ncbi:MAG: symmetrical bis(5'-nucleosyl)-tetraphosphatase [Gammaproteobacteria bacterium]|nr:symmetrical bis(5'-nucleosyl)-tetraphosphatase [Gammaproteobacteria bacterium]
MATYAIGDVQGCHRELMALLAAVSFNEMRDRLWLVGDLVNRGPQSAAVLRSVMALGASVVTVLGNHDLHLLACACVPGIKPRRRDTLDDILDAPDRDAMLAWLRRQPLLHHDATLDYTLVHAGLAPQWDLATAQACAREVEEVLRGDDFVDFLQHMYGDEPAQWQTSLRGHARLRYITNCLTRIRYCGADGSIDLKDKGEPTADSGLIPWFRMPARASRDLRIVFGHWSTLRLAATEWQSLRVYPLDTGAVWGGELTAMRLEDGALFQVKSTTAAPFD